MATSNTGSLNHCSRGMLLIEYRKLMNSNFKKEMKMAFELIDIGETGYIDLPELERICNQLNMGFSKEEIEKMIEKASNGTGKVYFDKFTEMMKD